MNYVKNNYPFQKSSIIKLFIVLFFCFSKQLHSQINKTDLGSWVMFFNQTRFHNKWSLHSEIQFRSYEIKPNTEQLLIRVGINYHYNPGTVIAAGYGSITNYKDDGEILKSQIANENRTWQQLSLRNNIGRIFLEHRYRFEQRWIYANKNTAYKNRIRYLLRVTVPVNNKEITKKTVFLTFYDEIFIHLNNTPFDRNRLYGAVGYQLNSSLNIQAGYLLQTVGTLSKQYFQLGITYNPDLRKPAKPTQ